MLVEALGMERGMPYWPAVDEATSKTGLSVMASSYGHLVHDKRGLDRAHADGR